jgi:hypothetical protein
MRRWNLVLSDSDDDVQEQQPAFETRRDSPLLRFDQRRRPHHIREESLLPATPPPRPSLTRAPSSTPRVPISLDKKMETALRRNLDHAALRVNIQAGVREQMMLAFRRLRLPARNRTLRQRVASRAEAFVRHQALTRGFDRLNALLEWWRRIYARARRHSRLTDMMRVIERMRRELEGARRAERAARRRAERQQRTFLRMYARLLLSRWRDSNVQFFVALRTSRFEVLRTRLQARGAVGAWCVACTECKARAAMRVSALALAAWHRAARGVVVWSVHASERRAAHREVLVQGRRAESHRQSMQLARVRRALGAWRRSNSRRVRAHALASRALRRWVRAAARSRDALRRQRLLAGHKPFADDHRRRF